MNILVIGSGGREHAISWKIAQSDKVENLYVAPGNAGTSNVATNVEIGVNDFEKLGAFALENAIDLVVVGPEEPLVKGIADYFKADENLKNIKLVGPNKEGAQLEGSKDFSKEFMFRHNIPTAGYKTFTREELEEGKAYLASAKAPYVLKADGLAAGKGVIITESLEEAQESLTDMLAHAKFGDASSRVVIEEFLDGIELSVFVLTDGKSYVTLPEAKDYKRIGEGDTGLNTGGMGALSPVPFADETFMQKIDEKVVKPTIDGLKKDEIDYVGFIFFGLIKVGEEPLVIEYNVRMGDPETEVVMPRIKSDFVDALVAAADGTLDTVEVAFEEQSASTVMLVSGGYPEAYEKGYEITGLDKVENVIPFHAGTKLVDGKIVNVGGRVIAVSALGENIKEALEKSKKAAEVISWQNYNYRKDIGFDLLPLLD
ncbi:MAG: phosphoribosylamine--glycine ligase [Cytophagales bacterium]|nr:phosphoribosylamine--glycine ligase [Cytophagales bacterium]